MKSHIQGASRSIPCIPETMPVEIRPAKTFESRIPQTSNAVLTPSSSFVYQQLSRYMAPGKNGASMMLRKNRTVRRPAGKLVAAMQPLTIGRTMIQVGCGGQSGAMVRGRREPTRNKEGRSFVINMVDGSCMAMYPAEKMDMAVWYTAPLTCVSFCRP